MYRVAVVRGGPSEEHDVSMQSGQAVLAALDNTQFSPLDVVVSRAGEWLLHGKVWDPIQIIQSVDVVFVALHGSYGEDGSLQRYLDTHHIPYTGSKAYPSSIAFNKALAKNYLRQTNIKMAPHVYASADAVTHPEQFAEAVLDTFSGPYIVKPVANGSSLGTTICTNTYELAVALSTLLPKYQNVLVEKQLHGKEATVGVINNFREKDFYALPAVEIIPKKQFFDYEAKYDGKTEEVCPGCFSGTEKTELADIATMVHKELGLSQYSRSDFIVTKDGVYFLEVNTLPGLTNTSLFPKALDAVGISYTGFIQHLLIDAMKQSRFLHTLPV